MAIDMIERNELAALANSRVGGLKQFVDDKNQNYLNANGYVNLFGSRKKKKTAARQEIEDKYLKLNADCSGIDTSIEVINSDLEILIGRSNTAKGQARLKVKEQIDETTKILGEFKNRRIQLGCAKTQMSSQTQSSSSEIVGVATQYGASVADQVSQELQGSAGKSDMTKYLIYGGAALGLILIAVIVINARKK